MAARTGVASHPRTWRSVRELRRLERIEDDRCGLWREAVGIDGVRDEGAVCAAAVFSALISASVTTSSTMPGSSRRSCCLRSAARTPCGCSHRALVEDGHEHHVLAACVLQMGQSADHFLAEQAVGRAQIGLAGRSLTAPVASCTTRSTGATAA